MTALKTFILKVQPLTGRGGRTRVVESGRVRAREARKGRGGAGV